MHTQSCGPAVLPPLEKLEGLQIARKVSHYSAAAGFLLASGELWVSPVAGAPEVTLAYLEKVKKYAAPRQSYTQAGPPAPRA